MWEYYGKVLYSCKKVGNSAFIAKYPDFCLHLDELKEINPTLTGE